MHSKIIKLIKYLNVQTNGLKVFPGVLMGVESFWLGGMKTKHPSFQQYPFDTTNLGSVWSCSLTSLAWISSIEIVSIGGRAGEGVSLWVGRDSVEILFEEREVGISEGE